MSILRTFTRVTSPILAFGLGFALFPADWRRGRWAPEKLTHFNTDVMHELEKKELFKQLNNDPDIEKYYSSEAFPSQHRKNHVGSGLLFGPDLFEVDPILFLNQGKGELTAFYHLGGRLISQDGQIHNGVSATILDEGLCTCGFAKLPSKKGVTANLSIDFKNQAPPNSTVVLKAHVVEAKGRKVVIEGTLSTFPLDGSTPFEIASARCVLVEPKWFKYFRWFQIGL
ncbi:putative MIOREX complex component [Clavispora lusitaniae]|uniref:MIOREX complex component n=1 Tax=Clavispora lusitaniae TaxID=36911 RepID=A0AA91T1I5_CLALS|nr:putative MIOREX complex component [Clavispora lusitaniae]